MTFELTYFHVEIDGLNIIDTVYCNTDFTIREFLDEVEQLINRYNCYDEEVIKSFKDIHCVYLKGHKIEENSKLRNYLEDLKNIPICITNNPAKIIDNYLPLINLNDYNDIQYYSNYSFGYYFTANDKKTNKKVLIRIPNNTSDIKYIYKEVIGYRLASTLNYCGVVKIQGFRYPLTEQEKKETNVLKYICDRILIKKTKRKEIDFTGFIIVFEFVKNGKLRSINDNYLDSKGKQHDEINPTIRSKIIYGVASAMKYIHQKGAVIRYLNDNSILCDENYEPKISDIKYLVPNKTIIDVEEGVVGDPLTMAPEIIGGGDYYDFSSDVYSYGLFLYRFFTNKIRFDDYIQPRSAQNYMMKIYQGKRPKRPENIPDPYWDLIKRCWKKKAYERPTFEEIVEELKYDKYAINEYGMKTNLDELHEYQTRIDSFEINDTSLSNLRPQNDQKMGESYIFMVLKNYLLNVTFKKK